MQLKPTRHRLSSPYGFALVLGLLSLAFHRDLLPRLASAVPSDPGDPLLNVWILWWNARTIPFTAEYWNAPAFAPGPSTLALSETLLGLTWLTTPLQWVGASPVVAYNLLVLVTPVLNGLSMYWLCLTLTGRRDAAVIGGLAYAFAPYHASQLAHVQTQAMFWMPVALVGLHRYFHPSAQSPRAGDPGRDTGDRRWLVCLAAATTLNGLTCGYFLLYFAVLLGLALVWLTIASRDLRKLAEAAAALAAAALALAPVMLVYRSVRRAWNLERPFFEIDSFGADLVMLATGADRLLLWPITTADLTAPGRFYPQYPGIVIALLVMAAAVVAWRGGRRGAMAGLYAAGAAVSIVLALGPTARVAGAPLWRPAPFAWLMALPGFDATRVPALFGAITVLCLAVLAAWAVATLVQRHTAASRALLVALGLGIVADGWAVVPLVDVPPPIRVALTGDLVFELPPGDHFHNVAAMYRGMTHGRPVVNGYSGYEPPHWGYLTYDLGLGCYDSLDALRRGRALDVVIWVGTDRARRIDATLLERWGPAAREAFAGTIVYHLPRTAGAPAAGTVDHDIDLRPYCKAIRPR